MLKGFGFIFGLTVGIPLLIIIINFLFFRGNQVTSEQVKKYIDNSAIIEVFIPSGIKRNYKVYYPKLTRGNNIKVIYRHTFYAEQYQKYLMLVSFAGFDYSDVFNGDISKSRCRVIGEGGYFLVRANQAQWNDPAYGTAKNPIPIFGVEIIGREEGKPKDIRSIRQTKEQFDVRDEINVIFVEQYLDHFITKAEFNKLFN